MEPQNRIASREFIYLGIIILCCFIIYFPSSLGGFIYDDYPNIVNNSSIQIHSLSADQLIAAIKSGESGPLGRPVSMLSFSLNYYFAGLDAFYYKLVNILIHLLNGVLVYVLTRKLLALGAFTGESWQIIKAISLATTTIWLFHPINISSVAYVVQRMNELSALFTLAGLAFFIYGREKIQAGNGGRLQIVSGFLICGLLAVLSKENGALFYIYAGMIELIFFRFSALGLSNKRFLSVLYIFFIGLPFLLIIFVLLVSPELYLAGYQQRDFTLMQRIFTEFRVIWFYIYMILIPDIQQLSMHHDSFDLSSGWISPPSTLLAIVGILALVFIAIFYRKTNKVLSFGILFFLIGHSIESTILPLHIAFEHRNYLPGMGLLFILSFYMLDPVISPRTINARKLLLFLLIGVLAFSTYIKIKQWHNTELLNFYELEHNPESSNINYEIGRFYASKLDTNELINRKKVYESADYHFRRAITLDPGKIEAMTGLLILESSNNSAIDMSVISSLETVLRNNVITTTGSSSLIALLRCKLRNECVIEEGIIDPLLYAIADNTKLSGNRSNLLYLEICNYYIALGQKKIAFEFAEKGLLREPEYVPLRVILASLLIDFGRIEEAKSELVEIRNARDADRFTDDLSNLEILLDNL